jgi:AcrR family transcriptional regulator
VADAVTDRRRRTRAEQQAETRRALLDGAAVVVRERGLGASSVEAITAAAGYTRGAFYSNFSSKEELFLELLQDRVYRAYTAMIERQSEGKEWDSVSERLDWGARQLAAAQEDPRSRWLFELWLELLAHASRHPEFAKLAAGLWSGNRERLARMAQADYAEMGRALPVAPELLATGQIALDIGLAVQHLVDPAAVNADAWPQLYELLFTRLLEPEG